MEKWIEVGFDESLEYNKIFDKCKCGHSDIGYFIYDEGMDFCIKCFTCNTTIVELNLLDTMIKWNKFQREMKEDICQT